MLALNQKLEMAEISTSTRFTEIKYSQSEAISALLTDKSRAEKLVSNNLNMLIKAAKFVHLERVEIEALEHCQRLKVFEMLLARYLEEGKVEVLF